MNLKKLFHSYKDDNVAVPEFHSEEYDNLQDKTEEEENKERGGSRETKNVYLQEKSNENDN